jgi:hypothetical protein
MGVVFNAEVFDKRDGINGLFLCAFAGACTNSDNFWHGWFLS